jgi:hypothetical protein
MDNYVNKSIEKGIFHQQKKVLESQRDFRRQTTGKKTTTYNQYARKGGKEWQAFKQK